MEYTKRILFSISALWLAVLACEMPVAATPASVDQNALNTIVAKTVAAVQVQSLVPGSASPFEATHTSTAASAVLPPIESSTATMTLSPIPMFTPTPLVPLISVSVATNCRSGPGKIYDYWGALLVGETAEVVARDPSGKFWYIRNPDSEGNFCWLWGEYATLSGNLSLLPVYTPPPTPTPTFTPVPTVTATPRPSFKTSLSGMDACAGSWWVDLHVTNNGAVSFKSYSISVNDKTAAVILTDLSDGFADIDGCLYTTTKDVIAPGAAYLLSSPAFPHNLSGHDLHVRLTLCSNTGQQGICATEKFDIVP